MAKFFYEFSEASTLGKSMFKFHHACVKADEAAENYAQKMGATAWYSDPSAFAGGVNCLEFDERKLDRQMWRPVEKINGHTCYEPAVSVVAGAIRINDDMRFPPSDTRTRTYAKTPCGWQEVRQFYTMRQWAAMIGYRLTGDKEADGKAIIAQLQNQKFLQFMEFHGEQQPRRKENKLSRAFLRAVRAEQLRMHLPVVPVSELYQLLQADVTAIDEKDNPSTPTFFLHNGSYYVALAYPCQHPDLHAITSQRYIYAKNMMKFFLQRSRTPS